MIEVEITGSGKGPDFVVLHGQPVPPESVGAITAALSAHGRVLVPDYCAIGVEPVAAGQMLARALVDQGVEEATLVGHSIGAYHAFQLAAGDTIEVKRIIGVGSLAWLPEEIQEGYEEIACALDAGQLDLAALLAPQWFSPAYLDENPTMESTLRGWFDAIGDERLAVVARVDAIGPDLHPRLPDLDLPVHLVVGELDQVTPPQWSQRIVELLPDATLDIVDGVGHFPHFEAEEATIELIRGYLEG